MLPQFDLQSQVNRAALLEDRAKLVGKHLLDLDRRAEVAGRDAQFHDVGFEREERRRGDEHRHEEHAGKSEMRPHLRRSART